MRAAVMQSWTLNVGDVADPVPQSGQALTKVLACGICGSDLHLLRHGAGQLELWQELAADAPPDPLEPVPFVGELPMVMGHEFCCEVVELGPGCENLAVGDVVVSMPTAFDAAGLHGIGFSNRYPGGYGELLVLNDLMALKVPNGLSPRVAALTEPVSVGVHAVAKSGIRSDQSAVVLGCGPVGLAVIAELKLRGVGPVVAADLSPTRRGLAGRLGADEVVDPQQESAIAAWRRLDGTRSMVLFEAVGVPGMLDSCMRMAPRGTCITVVGACLQADTVRPMIGLSKELSLQFVFGYEPHEFAGSLLAIAEGRVDPEPMITGTVPIEGVPQAFADLAHPDAHAKIMVEP